MDNEIASTASVLLATAVANRATLHETANKGRETRTRSADTSTWFSYTNQATMMNRKSSKRHPANRTTKNKDSAINKTLKQPSKTTTRIRNPRTYPNCDINSIQETQDMHFYYGPCATTTNARRTKGRNCSTTRTHESNAHAWKYGRNARTTSATNTFRIRGKPISTSLDTTRNGTRNSAELFT